MILSYSKYFPNGLQTQFEQKITYPTDIFFKDHTIRRLTHKGKRRWKPGDKIHFWMGNPRNKKNKRIGHHIHQFFLPHKSAYLWSYGDVITTDTSGTLFPLPKDATPLVYATEDIKISYQDTPTHTWFFIQIGKRIFSAKLYTSTTDETECSETIHRLARNDGFEDVDDFLFYFRESIRPTEVFNGQIIHWTNKKLYDKETAQTFESPKIKVDIFSLPTQEREPHNSNTGFVPVSEFSLFLDSENRD